MPTLPAPINPSNISERPANPPEPPTKLSSSQTPKSQESTIAAILFIISLLLLCSLVCIFIVKSTQKFRLETPVLTVLPVTTNRNTILVTGTGPKKAVIEISTESTSNFVDSDTNGNFALDVATRNDGKVTYFAIARKKILFFKFESERSNEITTVIDKTAPNLKIVSLPRLVTSSKYVLRGNSSEATKIVVKLNNVEHQIDTDAKNAFSFPLSLQKGNNVVVVTAKDAAGNETSTTAMSMNYAVGTVYASNGKNGSSKLPNSSGELQSALSTIFGRTIAIVALAVGILGFMASTGVVSLYKMFKESKVKNIS